MEMIGYDLNHWYLGRVKFAIMSLLIQRSWTFDLILQGAQLEVWRVF